jgi:hypothetical protein
MLQKFAEAEAIKLIGAGHYERHVPSQRAQRQDSSGLPPKRRLEMHRQGRKEDDVASFLEPCRRIDLYAVVMHACVKDLKEEPTCSANIPLPLAVRNTAARHSHIESLF